jgi:hypothetical protein
MPTQRDVEVNVETLIHEFRAFQLGLPMRAVFLRYKIRVQIVVIVIDRRR